MNWCSTFRISSDQKFTMALIMPNYAQKNWFWKKNDKIFLTQMGFELGTFGIWSGHTNHYTTKTLVIFSKKKWFCIINVRIFGRKFKRWNPVKFKSSLPWIKRSEKYLTFVLLYLGTWRVNLTVANAFRHFQNHPKCPCIIGQRTQLWCQMIPFLLLLCP